MNEIVHILDYSDTVEKQINLYRLIKKIKEKYPVVVSSHAILPEWILKECDFYFFDRKNLLIFDDVIKNNKYFLSDSFYVEYKPYNSVSAHIVSILRLILFVNSSMKTMGYDVIHQIEYDCKLENFIQFEENLKLIGDYDLVLYLESVHENSFENPLWFHGVYQTINLKSFKYEEFIYDELKIKDILYDTFKERKEYFQEKVTKKLLYENKKIYIKHLEDVKQSITFDLFTISNIIWDIDNCYSIFYNENKLYLFVDNTKSNESYELKLLIDNKVIEFFNIFGRTWLLVPIKNTPSHMIEIIFNERYVKKFDMKNQNDISLLKSTFFKKTK